MNALQLISSEGYFGAENMVVQLCRALRDLGCHSYAGVFQNLHRPNLDIVEQARRQGVSVQLFKCRGRIDIKTILAIRRFILQNDIHAVHTHGYKSNVYGYLATRGLATSLVATCHLWTRQSQRVRLYDFLDRRLLRLFPKVVGVSQAITKDLRSIGIDPLRISLVSNGIDFEQIQAGEPVLRREVPQGAVVVGTVCRLTEQKGLIYLLHAFRAILARHPQAHLLIVGEGRDRAVLQQFVATHGLENDVTFAGLRRDMPNVYASIDIFVLPSIDEGLPIALLEALSFGKPSIGTRVGDVPKLILDGTTGLLVESRDAAALAAAVVRLMENAELCKQLGEAGRTYVRENYSAESMARRYLRLYANSNDKGEGKLALNEEHEQTTNC